MPDQLLPPDPSKDARYWLTSPDKAQVIGMWRARSHRWIAEDWIRPGTPRDFGGIGYRLASPHPIPTPERLNALCEMRDALSQGADEIRSVSPETASAWGTVVRELDDLFGGKPAPNDPPGNGLDDIRAAAMDQCGVPRAGEETAP